MKVIGAVIFVIGFILFLAVTLAVPMALPPGNMIHGILGIPEVTYPVLGIPGWKLINALTNGFFWGFIIWLVFSLANFVWRKGK